MSGAVGPLLTAFGAYRAVRYESDKRARERARVETARRGNLLEYEAGRRERAGDLRRSLSQLRADRLAAGFGGSLSLRAQEGGLLREFAEEEELERDRLGLRNERVGVSRGTGTGLRLLEEVLT
ncbi:MAG: hypothetical protein MPJ52_02025 [Alphaproteobacteria bacterium]|nr:hypothetical protein [Alphaproteobacteria bacterium]MDA7987145.1 hypothetical protein [Alphaproteobacteria bacterium]